MSHEFPSQSSQYINAPQAVEVPSLQPFSESDSPDAIALRSAISILQIQRQQALRDIISLEQQKKLAAADPQAFARAVATSKIKTKSTGPLDIQSSFASTQPYGSNTQNEEQGKTDTEMGKETDTKMGEESRPFEDIPGPQTVVRCPPINWAKYHVLGQPLDNLHEEQRRRPVGGQSTEDGAHIRGEDHVIAAPYNPWKDRLEPNKMRISPGSSRGSD
ncbi:MAG: hypothetical protein Q9166_003626 [cf. Caloplaca sp. 2 TL-2023]